MTRRYVIEHVEPRSLREARTPRTLNEAFGPYARLDSPTRSQDRGLYLASIWPLSGLYLASIVLAASVAALLLAGLIR